MIYDRNNKAAKGQSRKIVIDNCYGDCPYATGKYSIFSCSFHFKCSLLDREVVFDDNLMHFSVLEDCPLEINNIEGE